MPWPILAHQAPVLPLRMWRPEAFNGTALVVGSIAPDFEYLLTNGPIGDGFPHSVSGQFLFCLPVTLAIVLTIGWLDLGRVLVSRTHGRGAWLLGAATDVLRKGGVMRAAGSALIGSCSHVALDTMTHLWLPRVLPAGPFHLANLTFSSVAISQIAVSAGLAVPALWFIYRLSRSRGSELPPQRSGVGAILFFGMAGATLGVLHCVPAIRNPDDYFEAGKFYVWGDVMFQAACGTGAGIIVALMLLSLVYRKE